jgi:peptide/nickel transport system permease protein
MLTILFSVQLGWLPVGGMRTVGAATDGWAGAIDVLRHLALPAISLGLFYAATYTRVMRASVLEVARLDFVRAARARGLRSTQVLWRHTVRNALLPVVTLLGLQLGTVLGGAISVEAVFGWPGIGSLLLDSVMSRDYPVVLGIMVLSSVFTLLINTLVDLAYLKLDPRILAR